MNKDALIKRLIAKCRSLDNTAIDLACKVAELERERDQAQAAAESAREDASFQEDRADRLNALARRADERANQAQREARDREWQRDQIVRQLERARSWGDKHGEERALRDLRNL